MDFREQEKNFQEADRRYAELARERDDGSISDEEFEEQRQQLGVEDDQGRQWAKRGESGEWHRTHDGNTWVRSEPPAYQEAGSTVDSSPTQTQSPPEEEVSNEESARRKMPFWIPLAALVGVALLIIVLIIWVILPLYLQGESASSEQGGSDSAALDAAFIHSATPENISANSTFLENP